MVATERKIIVAQIGSPFKLSGEFKLFSWADPIESVFDLSPWLIAPSEKQINRLEALSRDFFSLHPRREDRFFAINQSSGKVMGKHLIGKIAGIDSPEAASILTHCEIYVPRSSLKPPQGNSYYWCDLIGLEVINQDNVNLGVVKKLIETKANSILEIKPSVKKESKDKKENLLIPFVQPMIKKVDFKTKKILVDWQE